MGYSDTAGWQILTADDVLSLLCEMDRDAVLSDPGGMLDYTLRWDQEVSDEVAEAAITRFENGEVA
jgi:hypothetical protein